jgi:prepilin-type N-terminal cleavage/methylation domain-containing protein
MKGFTLFELLVVMSLLSITALIGMPNISELSSNVKASRDVHAIGGVFGQLRSEAARRRVSVSVSFVDAVTDQGPTMEIDYENDGSVDEVVELSKGGEWTLNGASTTPPDLTIDSLGRLPAVTSAGITLGVKHNSETSAVKVYQTGLTTYDT